MTINFLNLCIRKPMSATISKRREWSDRKALVPLLYFCSKNDPAGTFYSPWQPFTDSTCPAVIIIHLSTSYILPPSYKNIHNTTSSTDTKRKPLCNTYDVRVRFIDLLNLNSLLTFFILNTLHNINY